MSCNPETPEQLALGLPIVGRPWPDPERFPHNADGSSVGTGLVSDLASSVAPLVIAGYASVEHLIGLFCDIEKRTANSGRLESVRVLIGVEPTPFRGATNPESLRPAALEREIADYWLERGISITQWPALIAAVSLLDQHRLSIRTSGTQRVHAKVYVGDEACTVGSSNYTEPGLHRNMEANVRFVRDLDADRYREATDFAENVWALGTDYTDSFRDLLSRLLNKVTWREALARACAEILEGDWAAPFYSSEERRPLWPSQEQGISQALWILENVGSVLIADATGAGKTKMGAHLLRRLQERNWRTGRSPSRYPMLICPPSVEHRWQAELVDAGHDAHVRSHGLLSRRKGRYSRVLERSLEQTQLLTVDEAHNFLNRGSARSKLLYGNGADHTILLTATPINRGASDLLSIVDLLGADNFDDGVLEIVSRLGRRGGQAGGVTASERDHLKAALQHFVVRRTKRDFNALIDREPEAYTNALGERCRFPEHRPVTFRRHSPPEDSRRAVAIQEAAGRLRGVINLQTIELPRFARLEGWTAERFLEMRLRGASALAAYQVRSTLRSSKAALVEHLIGTEQATSRLGISIPKPQPSGNVIESLESLRERLPKVRISGAEMPSWLTDPDHYRKACDDEVETYRKILMLAEEMSDQRAEENARYLNSLLQHHERILAFDSHVISLHDLSERLRAAGVSQVALATGQGGMVGRLRFAERFALDASEKRLVGLCSDALAEGLNLQGASAVVHLDMPTVIRILEQRIGRVDRMDSPHPMVEVHWPQEPPEFRLRSDDKLLMRLQEVEDLLGSNVPLPKELETHTSNKDDGDLALERVIAEVDRARMDSPEVELTDAFAKVRELVSGPDALIAAETYEALRDSTARVLASVSVVRASEPWVFLAIGASDRGVPRWLMVHPPEAPDPTVVASLDEVAAELRLRLSGSAEDLAFDSRAGELLEHALNAVRSHRIEIMPLRKQRALRQLSEVLGAYHAKSQLSTDELRQELIAEILAPLTSQVVEGAELERIAEWWLRLVRPEWMQRLSRPRVPRPLRLRHLTRELKKSPVSTERLATFRDIEFPHAPIDRRVAAAIVGVA